jgi:diacylglycerol kinase (ATP)
MVSTTHTVGLRTALVVANPSARGVTPDLLPDIERCVASSGGRVALHLPESVERLGETVTAAVHAAGGGLRLVVVCVGGDGTVRAVAEAMARGQGTWPDGGHGSRGPALLIVPGGSGNSVYRALWGDRAWPEVLRAGLIEDEDEAGAAALDLLRIRETDRASVLGLNVGLGGRVAELLHGVAAVDDERRWAAIAEALEDARAFDGRVVVDGETLFTGSLTQVTVGGARHFMGGGFELLPRARLDDGLLDVCVVTALDDAALGEVAGLMPAGRHLGHPNVLYRQGTSAFVERTDGRDLCFEHDGDAQPGRRSVTVEVVAGAVALPYGTVVPPDL